MSTGYDCRFTEKSPRSWYYELETYHRGVYDTFGPFVTFREAREHLRRHHANPGGYTVTAIPGCKHDLLTAAEFPDAHHTHNCDRCGEHIDKRSPQEQQKVRESQFIRHNTAAAILLVLGDTGLSKRQQKALADYGITDEDFKRATDNAKRQRAAAHGICS